MEGNEMQEEGMKMTNSKNLQLLTPLFAHGWGRTAALDCICGLGAKGPNQLEQHMNLPPSPPPAPSFLSQPGEDGNLLLFICWPSSGNPFHLGATINFHLRTTIVLKS
jgi:hypothetical protein